MDTIEARIKSVEERVSDIEKLVRDMARALKLIGGEEETLETEEEKEVLEALRDWKKGKSEKFITLEEARKKLLSGD